MKERIAVADAVIQDTALVKKQRISSQNPSEEKVERLIVARQEAVTELSKHVQKKIRAELDAKHSAENPSYLENVKAVTKRLRKCLDSIKKEMRTCGAFYHKA